MTGTDLEEKSKLVKEGGGCSKKRTPSEKTSGERMLIVPGLGGNSAGYYRGGCVGVCACRHVCACTSTCWGHWPSRKRKW